MGSRGETVRIWRKSIRQIHGRVVYSRPVLTRKMKKDNVKKKRVHNNHTMGFAV